MYHPHWGKLKLLNLVIKLNKRNHFNLYIVQHDQSIHMTMILCLSCSDVGQV